MGYLFEKRITCIEQVGPGSFEAFSHNLSISVPVDVYSLRGCCRFSYMHCINYFVWFCCGINCPYVVIILFAINQLTHASLIQRRDLIQNPMIRIYGHRVAWILLLTGIYHVTLSRWFLSSYKEFYNEIYTEFAINMLVML